MIQPNSAMRVDQTKANLRKNVLLAINDGPPKSSLAPAWSSYEEILARLERAGFRLSEAELVSKLQELAGDRHRPLTTFVQLDETNRRAQLMLQGISNLKWLIDNS